MPITLDGTNGITTPTYGGADTSEYLVPVTQFKNRIINGAMVIDQRNAGASVTSSSSAPYTLDRWMSYSTASSKYTIQQNAGSVTPPTGFTNYLGCTSSSAYTIGTSEVFSINQFIEGFNTADLGWGTANAKTVTLSFWVRSSLTGTFGGAFANSAGDRSYPFTYTISSANTWEYKTITVAGDTTGTWLTNNGIGIKIFLSIGAASNLSGTAGAWAGATYYSATGATSVVGTNGATFYITGVQLEVGSTATSFDYRDYTTELNMCYRYFQYLPSLQGNFLGNGGSLFICGIGSVTHPMRTTPTGTLISGTNMINVGSVGNYNVTAINNLSSSNFTANTNATPGAYVPGNLNATTPTFGVWMSAEL